MYMEEWWDTTTLCETFGVSGACCMLVDVTPIHTQFARTGWKHTEETKERMSLAAQGRDMTKVVDASVAARKGKPAHNRGTVYQHHRKQGKLIKDGVIYEIDGIQQFAKKNNLISSKVGEVLNGRRRSHKGFRRYE